MYRKTTLVLLALAVTAALPAPLLAELEIDGRYWGPSIDGVLRVQEGDLGTDIELPDQLGIDDEEHPEIRFTWRHEGGAMVRFSYMLMDYSGARFISEEIEFGGVVFPIDINVASRVELDFARLGFGWLFSAGETFEIGPLVELKGVEAEAELVGRVLSFPLVSARETEDAVFGSGGLIFDFRPIPKLHIFGEALYSPGLDLGEMSEAEIGVKYYPFEAFSVSAGYRTMELDLEDDDDRLDLEFSGPFIGASVTF